ncbi:cysteine proteinase [Choiromyces venosus 120613-1]|uniref:Ubiquitin carboxyl-terminal hydrolase n=1 Tax=Choiromyces venosus 120613-1 TaxID=1336337 RepID=A0A3N4K4K7_9PEZI|nr:cysteine proteinase [Choiromyces venosus 120613-1]
MSEPVHSAEGGTAETPNTPSASVDVPKARKAFIPLECNPELMTSLVHKLGLSPSLAFHDVFSISDPELLAFVPRPALALLLVFPVSESYQQHRIAEDAGKEEYSKQGDGEDPVWFKQTIKNACGMIGVLHAVCNGAARNMIGDDSSLKELLSKALPLLPLERAQVLEDSQELASAHKSAASLGSSAVPDAEADVDLHYVCFVKAKDNHLYELDGQRKGPLDRGGLGDDDVLCEKAVKVVQTFIDREKESGRLEFSLVTLAPSMD